MKIRILPSIIFSLLLMVSYLALAQNDDPVVMELAHFLEGFQTYQANFTQTTYDNKGNIVEETKGRVMIHRPGQFRWETYQPTTQIIIVSGQTLWTYDVDLQQATKRSIDQKVNLNPASLLSDAPSDLVKQFVITKNPQKRIFVLKPRNRAAVNFQELGLRFEQDKLTSMTLVNDLGEISVFTFGKIQINQSLSPSLFQFKPPPGVDVITQ